MNMSFGVQAAPPATGDVGGVDPPPASSTPSIASTPLPPVAAPFSASFTFQGPSGNVLPPSRPPSTPGGFSYAGAPPRFTYPNAPAPVPPSAVPPSASPAPPFSVQPGFTFQGAAGNVVGMATPQAGSPAVGVRPFPPAGMPVSVSLPTQAVVPPPLQVANPLGSQAGLPGSTATPEETSTQSSSLPTGTAEALSATLPSSLQVAGTQARPVAQAVTPSITGLQGQIQIPAVSPGAVPAARPGLALPTSTTLPYVPPRPAFTPAPVGAAIVPPGGGFSVYCISVLLTFFELRDIGRLAVGLALG
ncbi:hypothetical protein GOP47_0027829 [Adiantum capillus-veneris]|nr:hypothetical protein GOP47_0027829 [Adiantum capillus-veneris]